MNGALASVHINGEYFPIKQGVSSFAGLQFNLVLENKAENLYSWVVYLKNDSDEKSPRITKFYGLDTSFSLSGKVMFNTLRGDDSSTYSFYPECFELADGERILRSPHGGRSSNTTAFPYFDMVDSKGKGFVCGIGWSGQWMLEVERNADQVHLTAGFQDCDFYLEPHEEVRSVRILIYVGDGGEDRLRHCFVRLHREYYSPIPQIDNDAFLPISAMCIMRYSHSDAAYVDGINFVDTEEAQLSTVCKAAECKKFNAYWLDASWFLGSFREGVGNYQYGKGFPEGIKKLGEKAREHGMKFILWFEPTRAFTDTEVYREFVHDDHKLMPTSDSFRWFVNLGDPDVWQYQFERIAKVIEESGVQMYRQDFNIDPYNLLKRIEPEGRVGIAQIRFVEGIYKLWDALLARFPGLKIDNCASGGRLIDVETNMRAIPLWRSDVSGRPAPLSSQNEILGLSKYIPYHQGGTYDYTPYFMRSSATTGICCQFGFISGVDKLEKDSLFAISDGVFTASEIKHCSVCDPAEVEKALDEVLVLREYWKGDFTALTPPSDQKSAIVAYSLHLEEEQRGVVLIFRREEAADQFVVKLPYILPDRQYVLVLSDEDFVKTEKTVMGKELQDGLVVDFSQAPASLLIYYKAN